MYKNKTMDAQQFTHGLGPCTLPPYGAREAQRYSVPQ